jgi:hypothetical protein
LIMAYFTVEGFVVGFLYLGRIPFNLPPVSNVPSSENATPSDLPVGRYVQFPMDDRKFVLLDTRTGNVYAYDVEKKTVVEINLVDLANKQRATKAK